MAKRLQPVQATREERTFRVERECPTAGDYRLRIHRQTVTHDDAGVVIATSDRTFAYDESSSKVATRAATVRFLTRLRENMSPESYLQAEAEWYDGLVDEVDAEAAAKRAADQADKSMHQ